MILSNQEQRTQFLNFNIWVLKTCLLWPENLNFVYNKNRLFKDSVMILSLMPCAIPILADFVFQLSEGVKNLTKVVEDMIALNCIIGMIYMVICFISNRRTIQKLVISIRHFEKYSSWDKIIEVDDRANLFCKVFMFYGILGNFVYMLMPQLSVEKCRRSIIEDRMPCGLVVRSHFPFNFGHTPVYEMIFIHQIYTCTMVSIVVLSLTMLLCGLLMHTVNQLNHLRIYVKKLRDCPVDKLYERLVYIIRYHIDIIEYSKEIGEAFSTMLLFYITLTSLVLSVLCFEIIMVEAFEDSVRFSLHLVGWLVILLSVCYNGQLLIDESWEVANDIYSIPWFEFPVEMQQKVQMIILRSQKALSMSAAGMGIVSLQAFLKVLSTAYSFFTLLLKFKA
ncbi:odorant receptor 67c-like [Sitophilus oryzae]|uniref:Odorant receptor n=1 Tax=Sitophilus oryzae TaxID=7048 RepID=A0A6J2Y7E2_SITOR|nr:odorant receptor 67c-like [Sitophilus oryzae]